MRSWCALFLIISGGAVLGYLAIVKSDPQYVMLSMSTALGFLFGKAAGRGKP